MSRPSPSERHTPTTDSGRPEQDWVDDAGFDDFLRRVCAAVAEFTGGHPERVAPDRLLCAGPGSLGIDGADADDLLALLRDRFGTTFARFPRDAYFGPERSFDPISFVYRSLAGRDEPLRLLTVGELASSM